MANSLLLCLCIRNITLKATDCPHGETTSSELFFKNPKRSTLHFGSWPWDWSVWTALTPPRRDNTQNAFPLLDFDWWIQQLRLVTSAHSLSFVY